MSKGKNFIIALVTLLIISCDAQNDHSLASFEVYCEMVAFGAKPIALSLPMTSSDMDAVWDEYVGISEKYGVSLFRESAFPVTPLFPAIATYEKDVAIIYKDQVRLQQYAQFKMDDQNLGEFESARRLGRLLGYNAQGVNDLLIENTDYRPLSYFNTGKQVTHFYYQDLSRAQKFYSEILGLNRLEENVYMISPDTYLALHAVDSLHPASLPKSTALALLTDQLPQWYRHIRQKEVPVRFAYKSGIGNAHDGFVVEDPEGYLLEFEQFKQHPENERFFAILEKAPRVQTTNYPLNFHGSVTWTYHIDLLKMQKFYEEVLGYALVADQGWTKIYQTSPTGFIGLVDECRGMEDHAEKKLVEIEWQFDQSEALYEYLQNNQSGWSSNNPLIIGPEKYKYRLN